MKEEEMNGEESDRDWGGGREVLGHAARVCNA